MTPLTLACLTIGAICAAAGQLFLKLGATDQVRFIDFVNWQVALGFAFYGFGAVLWVYAMSKAPLVAIYPFTVLTFVLVYLASYLVLGESLRQIGIVGVMVVLVGLAMVVWSVEPKG